MESGSYQDMLAQTNGERQEDYLAQLEDKVEKGGTIVEHKARGL